MQYVFTLFVLILFPALVLSNNNIHVLEYSKWTIHYNCEKRGAEFFYYETVADTGSIKRLKSFHKEPKLPQRCQQFSNFKSYQSAVDDGLKSTVKYDLGHMVHQNIWDHNNNYMYESNSMANVIPQQSNQNRNGAWRFTEEITECNRGTAKNAKSLKVWGGVIWGDDQSNDYFIESHGVVTPDYLWKVIEFANGQVNAWIIPNDASAKRSMASEYLVTPGEITLITGYDFEFSEDAIVSLQGVEKNKPCSLK